MACKTKAAAKAELDAGQKKILKTLAGLKEPVNGKAIAEATGLDSKAVSNYIKGFKADGWVDSPVRCKYAITPAGKKKAK